MCLKHTNVRQRKGRLMRTPQFLVGVTEEKFDSFYDHVVCRTLLVVCHLPKQCLAARFWCQFDALLLKLKLSEMLRGIHCY